LNPGSKNIERYFTIKEAAALLRRHPRTVWRWTLENKIAFHQPTVGCKILIPEREINRLRPRDE
jgi:excisionase family DNA binding protein